MRPANGAGFAQKGVGSRFSSDGKSISSMPTDPEKRLPTPFVRKADGARRIGPRFRSLSLILPNWLSFARLAMGLAFPWTPSGWRLGVVIAAAVSDLVDGAISS